jgi:protein Mpv17
MFASSSSYARLFARKAAAPAGGVVASASFSLGFCYDRQVARVVVNNHQRKLFSSSSNNNTSSNNSNSFLSWYEANLNRRPVLTKSITGCSLWGIGDAVAQLVPDLAAGWKQQHEQQQQQQNDYDLARTARACFYGFAIHAPLSHLHFNFLEYLTIKGGFKGLQITVFKTVMEQFVYWSWLSNALYHGSMGAMQGKTLQQSWDYIQSVIWETQKVSRVD